jgi:soluble lytic murein transglycosylase-like protein
MSAATVCILAYSLNVAPPGTPELVVDAPVETINRPVEAMIVLEEPEIYVDSIDKHITTYNIALSEELQQYTYKVACDYNVGEYYELILALMWVESRYDPSAIGGGANYGLMQINKINHGWLHDELGIDNFLDPKQNIMAGVRILSEYLTTMDEPHRALMCYSMGVSRANSYWKRGVYTSEYSHKVLDAKDRLEEYNEI